MQNSEHLRTLRRFWILLYTVQNNLLWHFNLSTGFELPFHELILPFLNINSLEKKTVTYIMECKIKCMNIEKYWKIIIFENEDYKCMS